MQNPEQGDWMPLIPDFGRSMKSPEQFRVYARQLRNLATRGGNSDDFADCRQRFLANPNKVRREDWPTLKAAGLLLTDLVEQQWGIRIRVQQVQVRERIFQRGDALAEKSVIRHQELLKRDAQLRKESVQRFISKMERKQLFGNNFVSIFSLMRDGKDLADRINAFRSTLTNGNGHSLFEVIDPYLEFVEKGKRCQFTGLRLMDIWRYFRHTWTNQYTSVPGRTMMYLVRDRSADNHPIIGIGALSSPIVQLGERDRWIGWHPETVLQEITDRPTIAHAKWLRQIVDDAIDELYVADFLKDGLLSRYRLKRPNGDIVAKLVEVGAHQRRAHHRYTNPSDYKRSAREDPTDTKHWKAKAESHLFRSKRAYALATLLQARLTLQEEFGDRPTAGKLASMIKTATGRSVVKKIVRKAKADRVGIAMADVSVCGAVAPYNALLGGKLVAMLSTSPEVIREYRKRYTRVESEIASAMAGKPIRRPANLVFLGTTSLYGTHSSQYSRIRIPCDALQASNKGEIRYKRLGRSESFGTSHFSDETVEALVSLVQQQNVGRRVNSIFGEGASPKFRKVREGLDVLGFPSEALLQHGRQRIIYGVALASNMKEYLLGQQKRPKYLVPIDSPGATKRISEWWMARWLRNRIQRSAVLEEIARHNFLQPIQHGARVPVVTDMEQLELIANDSRDIGRGG